MQAATKPTKCKCVCERQERASLFRRHPVKLEFTNPASSSSVSVGGA